MYYRPHPRTGESFCLALRGLVFRHLDGPEFARESSARAVKLAREIGNRSSQSLALMVSGHALKTTGQVAKVESAYRGSLAIHCEQNQEHLIVESRAGVAGVFLAQVIPTREGVHAGWDPSQPLINDIMAEYNAGIPAVVEKFRGEGKHVSLVDMWNTVQSESEFDEMGAHPNPVAAERMAQVWFERIVEILGK